MNAAVHPRQVHLFFCLTALYFLTSLGHFTHNASFLCAYPRLPPCLTRAQVYATWAAITAVGVVGLWLIRKRFMAAGLVVVAAYAAMGFDGLGHYALAPFVLHSFTANFTILSEVAAAALLLGFTLLQLVLHLRHRGL